MTTYSLGMRAIYAAQRYSRELAGSVWSGWFYDHLLDVLNNDTWRDYQTEAYGRHCQFNDLRDFLGHEDGLGWPSVDETLLMMQVVRDCKKPLPPEQNGPIGPDLQEWAKQALQALEDRGVAVPHTSTRHATTALELEGFNPEHRPADDDRKGDNVTLNDTGKGNSAAYLAARLKKAGRDDLLQQIGPEKPFRSVRAAAIEAGIIKPVPTVRLVDDTERVAAAIRKHLSPEQVAALKAAL